MYNTYAVSVSDPSFVPTVHTHNTYCIFFTVVWYSGKVHRIYSMESVQMQFRRALSLTKFICIHSQNQPSQFDCVHDLLIFAVAVSSLLERIVRIRKRFLSLVGFTKSVTLTTPLIYLTTLLTPLP